MKIEAAPEVRIEIQAGSRPDVTVLKVSGPLTIRNFFEFQDVARSNQSPVLIIDFVEVPYMDSAALGCVLGLHVSCERNKRKYALINVNSRLQTMFTVCGVQDLLVTFPTLAEAEPALA